jgi:hypothetical protein
MAVYRSAFPALVLKKAPRIPADATGESGVGLATGRFSKVCLLYALVLLAAWNRKGLGSKVVNNGRIELFLVVSAAVAPNEKSVCVGKFSA